MMRRLICRGLVVGALLTMSTGCETLHSFLRGKDSEDGSAKKEDKDDSSKIESGRLGHIEDPRRRLGLEKISAIFQEQPHVGGLELGGPGD